MRNPERIDPITDRLKEAWKKFFPDWRFFQLAENFLGWVYDQTKFDPFFIEDDQVCQWIDKFVNANASKDED